jgi:predicted small lipoprotein YifL
MLKVGFILGTSALLLLAACGQKGALYLPTGEAAAGRASLPQTLNPVPAASEPTNSGTGTANPAPRP